MNHFWKTKQKNRWNVSVKSVTVEHPKTSCNLSKTLRRAEKVSKASRDEKNSASTLYVETTQSDFFFFDETKTIKKANIMKRNHAYKGYASTYYVKLLNSLNLELQLKDTESIMKNKQEDLLS